MPKIVTMIVFNLLKLKGILTEDEVNLITKLHERYFREGIYNKITVN